MCVDVPVVVSVMDDVEYFDGVPETEKMEAFAGISTDAKLVILMREQRAFRSYVETMEQRAAEMANPDNLMKMAEKFMGGGFM